jgi:serine/threonine protein kinase
MILHQETQTHDSALSSPGSPSGAAAGNDHTKASTNLARSDVEQTLGTCYAHAAAQLTLHAWRRSGTPRVPAYGDLIHTIVTAHGCSGQDPLAAIATLSGFTRGLGLDGLPPLTSTPMGISGTEHANTIDDSALWRMQREGRGVALLTLQTSPEHWRRFTTHFNSEGTAAPLRTLTKLGDSESKMSGLVDVGLVIDLDRSRPGAITLLNTWDEHYRNPARRYSVASLAALQVPRSKLELYDVQAPASSQPEAPFDLPDLTDRLVRISASHATFENRLVTMINRTLDMMMAQRLWGHPFALRVLGYASVDDSDDTRWLVTERVDVWACDTTKGEVSGEERLRMLMHTAAAWEELTEAGQRPRPHELDSSMVAGIGSMWKLAPFAISATQEDAVAGADDAEMPCEPEELLACSHHDFLQHFTAYGRVLVTDDVRTCLASRLQLRRNVKARKCVDEALITAGGVMDRVADHIASVVTALYRRVLLQTTIEDTLWMENIEESLSSTAAKLDSFAARLRDVADGFVEPPSPTRSTIGRTARWQREDVTVPDWSPCATSLTMKSCPEAPDAWPCLARMTCQSGQTSPQAMAAAFGAEGSSPASRWQLRPALRFNYEHGDNKRTAKDIIGLECIPTLEVVWLSGTSVTDVRHLASTKALKRLVLSGTKVTAEGTKGLERIPTLETLRLDYTLVTDVRHLASAKALKQLDLRYAKVTTEGTKGLERIPTLEKLDLWSTSVTDVQHLASAKALKYLVLSSTTVTTEGTKGLERIPTLETLHLSGTSVTDVRHLALAKALKQLDLSNTKVTTEGTMGLERIPTLETLRLGSTSVTDVRHLASSKKLKYLDLSSTKVTTEGTMGLESIPTLEGLDLSSTPTTTVRHLASSKKLTWLRLAYRKVATEDTVGLERALEAGTGHREFGVSEWPELDFAFSQIDGEDSVGVSQRGAYKRSSFVESYENLPFGSVFASGGSAQIRSVGGRPDILAKIYHHHVLSNAMDHQRETDILQSLRHDYIVSIRGLIKDGDVVRGYLMEAMDGNLLHAMLTPQQRLVALRQCAEGLSYAHSRDVTHGDVKPENCLVSVRNAVVTAKVCDFGMARVLSTMASTTIHGGTVLYTAPEGNTHPKAADVFAFGLTMWMVLSAGHDHGLGNSIADVIHGIIEGRRPPLDVHALQALPSSGSVCELLQRCWASAPTRRPTMTEVMLDLEIILRSVPLAVNTPEPPLPATSSLTWSRSQRYRVSSPLAADHDLFHRVASLLHLDAARSRCCVRRVQLVQHDDRDVFWRIHRAEAASLKQSEHLRASPLTTGAAKAALAVLDTFVAKAAPHLQDLLNAPVVDGNSGLSRIVFAWFGATENRLDAVCRDGLRALRARDDGFFGNGVYLAMEADYARRYALSERVNDHLQTPATLILYACSISQVYPITLEADYRPPTCDMGRDDCGMSRFHGERPLEAKFDAHFVPVRNCGDCHPWDGVTRTFCGYTMDYQAATEEHPNPAMRPTAHELVLGSGLRCTPVALVEVCNPTPPSSH